jgi:hypothetical protein
MLVLLVAFGASAHAESSDNPLTRAVPRADGSSACFSRAYDAAHLKQNPRQVTQGIMLSLRFEETSGYVVRIMLRQKNKPAPLHIVGVCGWSDRANLGVDDKPLIKAFKATAGLDCHAYAGLDSDEEGGDFPVDFVEPEKSLTLYLFDQVSAWSGTNQKKKTIGVRLGKDDLIFRLDRVDAVACRGMERALQAK